MKVKINFNAVIDHKDELDRIRKKCDELIGCLQQISDLLSEGNVELAQRLQQRVIVPVRIIRNNAEARKALLDDIVFELKKAQSFMEETVEEIGVIVNKQTDKT